MQRFGLLVCCICLLLLGSLLEPVLRAEADIQWCLKDPMIRINDTKVNLYIAPIAIVGFVIGAKYGGILGVSIAVALGL